MRYFELKIKNEETEIDLEGEFGVRSNDSFYNDALHLEVPQGKWKVYTHRKTEKEYISTIDEYKNVDNIKLVHLVHETASPSDVNTFEILKTFSNYSTLMPPVLLGASYYKGKMDYDKLFEKIVESTEFINKTEIYNKYKTELIIHENRLHLSYTGTPTLSVKRNENNEIVEILFEVGVALDNETVYLGLFEVKSNEVIISDPCYTLDTWCMGILDKVVNGTWQAFVNKTSYDYFRCNEVFAVHDHTLTADDISELTDFHIGVDSGQAGIFDKSSYRTMEPSHEGQTEEEIAEEWYRVMCKTTSSEVDAGVVDGGVVSSSGYGDGGYKCYVHRDYQDMIDGIKIVFIGGEDDDDDDDEEYDEEEASDEE